MNRALRKTESIVMYTLGVLIVTLGFIAHWTLYVLPSIQ